ncbi:MAG: hypothetical protein OD918_10460 [Gammaproteobacteria bacterium]
MSHRFIVGANPVAAEEKKSIRNWLDGKFAWWSWIDGFWLIKDSRDTLTASEILDRFHDLAPNAHIMVVQVPPGGTWAGYGPGSSKNPQYDMFNWIRGTWESE